jgi:formylglycine-generating enzyme required for sulfatase activity
VSVVVVLVLLATLGSTPKPKPAETKPAVPAFAIAPFDEQQAKDHQQRWAEYLELPTTITNSIGMQLALIPPGEFMMGSPDWDSEARSDEKPQHRVRITKTFYLGVYEVTQAEY